MPRLRGFNHMCSRTVPDTANRLRKTRKKKSSAVPLISERSHIGNLRQIKKQGKGRSPKRKGNRRCPFLFAPCGGRRDVPPSADGESPTEVQRKTSRPLGANPPAAVRVPRLSGAGKGAARQGEPACGSSCAPVSRCRKRSRPSGRTRLRQFAHSAGSVQKNFSKDY